MKHTECRDCKLRNGDCGYHFEMDGNKNYGIASLTACDQYGNCMFFKPEEKMPVVLSVWEHDSLAELTNYLYTKRVHYYISVTAKGDGRRCTVYSVIIPEITKDQLHYIRDKLRIRIPEV